MKVVCSWWKLAHVWVTNKGKMVSMEPKIITSLTCDGGGISQTSCAHEVHKVQGRDVKSLRSSGKFSRYPQKS